MAPPGRGNAGFTAWMYFLACHSVAVSQGTVYALQEVSTCSYLLHIATRQLCPHHALNVSPSKVKQIACLPDPRLTAQGAAGAQIPDAAGESLGDLASKLGVSEFVSSSDAQEAYQDLIHQLKSTGQPDLDAHQRTIASEPVDEDVDE